MHPATRLVAATAGVGALASTLGATLLAVAPIAAAEPAPGQAVENDWGQTAAQVDAEIAAAVDADPRVVAARTRYLRALAAYARLKRDLASAIAAQRAARTTPAKTDDRATARRVAALRAQVVPRADEVVASHYALTRIVDAVTAALRSRHYIAAPYVALPGQPAGLAAAASSGQVSLTWDEVPGAAQYRIYRDGTQVAATIVPAYLDAGLTDGTAYAYRVRAVNVAGWSPLSEAVVGLPTVAPPEAPTGLAATPGDGQVQLSWLPPARATGYEVFRDGALVATPVDPSFIDTGLVDGTAYRYTVVATNGASPSPASPAVTAVPVAPAPAAPAGVVASPGNGSVTLSWTPVEGATSYQVLRNGAVVGAPTAASYTDTGMTNGTSYSYTVRAYRLNSAASAPSIAVWVTPVAPPLPAPTGLAATPGDGQVGLTWSAVTGATSYRVYRNGGLVGSPTATAYTDTGLANGTSYGYTVVAVSAASVSPASAAVTATPAAAAPGAPTGLSGQAGDTTATLSWTAVSGATSYRVYRGGVLRTAVTATAWTDTGLTNGTAYGYYVTAVKFGVESAASATIIVTPVAVVPATPTGLVAAAGSTQVSLTWTAAADAAAYRVYRGGVLVGSPTGTSFLDTGLTNGTTYTWTVVAVNGTAVSTTSAPASATPLAPAPAAPSGLTATAGNAQVSLSWTASANATSYRVYRGGVQVGAPASTSYLDTGLTNGTAYSYYVVAVTDTTPSAASATVTATPAKPPVNGTFTGATTAIASGHGTLRVVIVLSNSKITSATGTLLTWDGSETQSINATAIPQYNTKAVTANSANITKVSGATLTWSAYKTSLQSALTQAGL